MPVLCFIPLYSIRFVLHRYVLIAHNQRRRAVIRRAVKKMRKPLSLPIVSCFSIVKEAGNPIELCRA
jgi:hypothetical protein